MDSSFFWSKKGQGVMGLGALLVLTLCSGLLVAQGQTSTCPLPTLLPYKTTQSPSVFYISEDCKKRPIKDPAVYFSHFSSWRDVRLTTPAILNSIPNHPLSFLPWGPRRVYQNGSLLKTVDDPKVYIVLDGIRLYPIENETVFRGILGYQFNQIEDVTPDVIKRYIIQTPITSVDSIPPTLIFKYPQDPKVYSLERQNSGSDLTKRYLSSITQITQNNFRADRIATLPAARFFADASGTAPAVRPLPQPTPAPTPTPTPSPTPVEYVPVPIPVPVPVPTPTPTTPQPTPTTPTTPTPTPATPPPPPTTPTTPPPAPSPSPSNALTADPSLSDEFNNPATLSNWSVMNSDLATTINIGSSVAGRLTTVAAPFTNNGWYGDNQGPFVYKNVTGNFVIEVYAREGRTDDITAQPSGTFKQVGIVIKNPSSPARQSGTATTLVTPAGQQNWIMYNMGMLATQFGREVKTTRVGSPESLSTLYMNNNPAGVRSARMRVCRVGTNFYFYYQFDGQTDWTEEVIQSSTVVIGNGSSIPTPGVSSNSPGTLLRFIRTDLPQTVQVGLIASNWDSPFNGRADFDYARFSTVSAQSDCVRDLPAAGTGANPSPTPAAALPAIPSFGDEFTDASTLSNWSNRQTVEATSNQISSLTINTTVPGSMTITPLQNVGWYNTSVGPFIYKNIAGDFVVTTQVSAHALNSTSQAPSQISNAAGLLVRVPGTTGNNQNWLTNNVGFHVGGITGATNLNTANGVSDPVVAQSGPYVMALRICRIGSTIRTFISTDAEQTWTQTNTVTRSDFPNIVQVGLMAVAASTPADIRADFDYIRAATPSSAADCTGLIAPAVSSGGTSPSPSPTPTTPSPSPVASVSAISGFGDEFADSNTLSQWSNRQTVEGTGAQIATWDINMSSSGNMALAPAGGNVAWYNTSVGPFIYKNITGDFVVSTQVSAHSLSSLSQAPGQQYNAAGLLIRNPAGASGIQNWVTNNVGSHDPGIVGTTNLSTVNGTSNAVVAQTGSFAAALRICRIGSTVRTYVSNDNEQTWTLTNTISRTDLPTTLQVGMMAVAAAGSNDMRADFSYIRAGTPASVSDCIGTLAPAVTIAPSPSPTPTSPSPSPSPNPTTPNPSPNPSSQTLTPIAGYSDDFSNAATLSNWLNRQVIEGSNNQIATWNINSIVSGNMVLVPSSGNIAWYQTSVGPFIYKNVTGNFVVSTRLSAHSVNNTQNPPGNVYNAAGLLVRDPASAGTSNQNWIEMALGNHWTVTGLVNLSTVNSAESPFNPVAGTTLNVSLRLCRIGSVFTMYISTDNEQTWTLRDTFTRTDLPNTLQVGMSLAAANANGNPDIQADYDYIRGAIPTSSSDCTASITQ